MPCCADAGQCKAESRWAVAVLFTGGLIRHHLKSSFARNQASVKTVLCVGTILINVCDHVQRHSKVVSPRRCSVLHQIVC
jgi:hypothetical protein